MYACLHSPAATQTELLEFALNFSPEVEQYEPHTVVFSIAPLHKLIGSPYQIASELSRAGYERNLQANLAVAGDPDSAILIAQNCLGITLVPLGEERNKLGPLPLSALFRNPHLDPSLLDVMHRWGVKTFEELAALPEKGLAERFGQAGVYLWKLACGMINRPLSVTPPTVNYEQRMALDHPLHLLEPLLFLLGRVVGELCMQLRSQSRAARLLSAEFELEGRKNYCFKLEFPVPLADSRTILKLLQLHLERHSPEAPVIAFTLRMQPVEPRRVQGGIFLPPTPEPAKLQVTLSRIAGMVGKENTGTPMLLNTHRPDAFVMTSLPLTNHAQQFGHENTGKQVESLRLAIRLFRPALHARVRVVQHTPKAVSAAGVKGAVIQLAGPWKTSGDWWATTAWSHEEWDVALDDGALYRIYQESQNGEWFVQGVYD